MRKNTNGRFPLCRGHDTTLYLTNIRSFQQNEKIKDAIYSSRQKHYGKPFKVRKNPPRFCGSIKSALLKIDQSGNPYYAKVTGLPCKSWSCPLCGPKKALKLKYELIELIKLNKLDHLLTLTLDPSLIPEKYISKGNKTSKYITYLFNRYILNLKRKMKKEIKYIWVKEFQKNGNAHLHIMLSCYLPIKYLRKEWTRIGGGTQMNIQQVKSIEATANYVSEYIVKGLKDEPTNPSKFINGERRYSISHSCLRPDKTENQMIKINDMKELSQYMSVEKTKEVYNMLQNPENEDKELVLAPHQEELNL